MQIARTKTAIVSEPVAGWPQEGLRMWPVGNTVGESPFWHPSQQALFWIDVRGQQLLSLFPEQGHLTRWQLPEVVGAACPAGEASIWLAMKHAVMQLDLNSATLAHVASIEPDQPSNRLNDGKRSPSGKWFVFGSMDDRADKEPRGALYALGQEHQVHRLIDGLVVANGIAWNIDATCIYYSDSFRGMIWSADWDEATAAMGTPKLLAKLSNDQGRPDGAWVDPQDRYWSAGVSAGVLNCFDVDGQIIDRIYLPCRAPTMLALGGKKQDTVYITSLIRPQWQEKTAFDGALFELPLKTFTQST